MNEPDATTGCCYGFEVSSTLPLIGLRAGSGRTRLRVEGQDSQPRSEAPSLLDLGPDPERPSSRIHPHGDGYEVWTFDAGSFIVRPHQGQIDLTMDPDPVLSEVRLWGIPTAILTSVRGDLAIHAAAVEIAGAALLLIAPSRHGKSTLAAALLPHGRLLSEDVTACTLDPHAAVLPGPALLRIRKDMFDVLDLDGAQVVRDDPDRATLCLDEGRRGSSEPVPLGAIVFLREADEDPRLERLDPQTALQDLWVLAFNLPTDEGRRACFNGVADLASRAPLFNLYRRLDLDSLPRVMEILIGTLDP